jgi:hypothetical protein
VRAGFREHELALRSPLSADIEEENWRRKGRQGYEDAELGLEGVVRVVEPRVQHLAVP